MSLSKIGFSLAAVTAIGCSVIAAKPASALELVGGFTATGGVSVGGDILNLLDGNAIFNFQAIAQGTGASGDFFPMADGDSISMAGPLVISGGVFTGAASLLNGSQPWMSGIASSQGDVNFVLQNISNYAEMLTSTRRGTLKTFAFDLEGYFVKSGDPLAVLGNGILAATILQTSNGGFTATIQAVPVPTPAAILPALIGLFGAAAKRQRQDEGLESVSSER